MDKTLIAENFYKLIVHRFYKERPNHEFINEELNAIWLDVYDKVWYNRNKQTYEQIAEYCKNVDLEKYILKAN